MAIDADLVSRIESSYLILSDSPYWLVLRCFVEQLDQIFAVVEYTLFHTLWWLRTGMVFEDMPPRTLGDVDHA